MDESFSDFKKKKKCNTGPKNKEKTKVKAIKKRPLKNNKTQRDIRVFVKGKENELVSYSKNFNEICKKSGLDVDSEQLQLAVALSKSLQNTDSSTKAHTSQEEKLLSSQERTAKIKLTLQEYGFKVSSTGINTNRNKRIKKQYKLLLLSEEEKKQIILDKYLKILETNLYKSLENIPCYSKQSELYYKATSVPFEEIKNNETFYVKDLGLEISSSISLLKDWSDIPGRPLSPKIQVNSFSFTDTNFTQTELDLILSGPLNRIKDILNNKNTEEFRETHKTMSTEIIDICIGDSVEVRNSIEKPNIFSNNISNTCILTTAQSILSIERSVSPDLFDDDITILDSTTSKTTEITFDKKDNQTCYMDLTECVAINNSSASKSNAQIYHENNVTKRKSNDFMDITNCIISSKETCVEKIDLTQDFIPCKINDNKETSKKDSIETMDLTQSSNSDVESEIVELKENESSDDTIIINDHNNKKENISLCEKSSNSDNDKNINKDNELPNENIMLNVTEYSETMSKNTEEAITMGENYCSPTYTYTDHVFDHSYIYDYDNFDDNSQEVGGNNSVSSESNHSIKNNAEDRSFHSDNICSNNFNLNKQPCSSNTTDEKSVHQDEIITENCKSSINNCNDLTNSNKEICEDLLISSHFDKNSEIFHLSKEIDPEETKGDSSKCIHDNPNIPPSVADENNHTVNHVDQLEDYNDYVFEHSYIYDYDDKKSPEEKIQDGDDIEIDLTQTSDVEATENVIKDDLGKIDNISVDYDDIIVVENHNSNNISKSSYLVQDKEASNCSKNSEVFEVSDKEFNYSLHQSRFDNYEADGFDDIEREYSKKSRTLSRSMSESDLNTKDSTKKTKSNTSHNTTPVKALSQDVRSAILQTPNNDYIIKTRDVTPMADYASMSSPERAEELKRYGLTPFKRKRGMFYVYVILIFIITVCRLPSK